MKRSTSIAFLALALTTVMSLAALPASASSTTYDFHFLTTSGSEYCDGMFFYNYGSPKTLVDGYHWNTFCSGGKRGREWLQGQCRSQISVCGHRRDVSHQRSR